MQAAGFAMGSHDNEVPYGLYARSRSATELYDTRCSIEYMHVAIAATGIFTHSKDCYVGYVT